MTSAGVPSRCAGIAAINRASSSGEAKAEAIVSDFTNAGASALTESPLGPNSRSSEMVSPMSAVFDSEQAVPAKSPPDRPANEDMLVIRPDRRATIDGTRF
ncbi:MAG: hypothetical protein AAGF79_02365 [Pseudomonadota bacterium]